MTKGPQLFYGWDMRSFLYLVMLFLALPNAAYAATCSEEIQRGVASWYGPGFEGSHTKSGEPFYPDAMSAAHPTLPFGTIVKITNLRNNNSVNVRINDRGAFKTNVIDVSEGAAYELGMVQDGTAPVALFKCNQ